MLDNIYTFLKALYTLLSKANWVIKTVFITTYAGAVFLLQRTIDVVAYALYSVSQVVSMLTDLQPTDADPIFNGATELLTMANTFVPFDTLFSCITVYMALRLASATIRMIKSFIPTIA